MKVRPYYRRPSVPQPALPSCPECGSKTMRRLECDEHGKACPLVVCCDCGAEVEGGHDPKKKQNGRVRRSGWRSICPNCGGRGLSYQDHCYDGKNDISFSVSCLSCGFQFVEHYDLVFRGRSSGKGASK